jgi:acyl-CoA synthetase (AMP-forming)/AMP-acid ligase II
MSTARTLPALVTAAAARFADRPAIEDGEVTLGFGALAAAGARAARAFLASGLAPGDRVGVWAPNMHEWVVAAIGIQSAGGVLVPLNTRMKGREVGYILATSGARLLCTVDEFLGNRYVDLLRSGCGGPTASRPVAELATLERVILLRGAAAGCTSWQEFLSEGDAIAPDTAATRAALVEPEDVADILFTSGTTGKPKGVMSTHAQNLRCFDVWCDVVGLRADDRYLIVNPYFHSFGYKAGWLACLLRGATNLPHPVFDVPQVLERVARDRVTVLPGPPTLYQMILAHPDRARFDLSSLRLAVTGAASIPVELIHRMRRELALETIVTAYGLTEATGVVTMCRPEDDADTIATTSGRAIPDVEVRCVDGDGAEVPRGGAGEIVVRGYNVMRGYFEDPVATAEAIDGSGWLHTGDVGVMDARGYLRITDRLKDMFITGGFNCYPAEIESILLGCPGVGQVAVIGIPDERLGEVAMAFVVPAAGSEPTADGIVAWSRDNMANYKVPRRIALVDALPMNATGKVTKFVLRQHPAAR